MAETPPSELIHRCCRLRYQRHVEDDQSLHTLQAGWAESLKEAILEEVPSVQCTVKQDNRNSFEITVDGVLIYSKSKTNKKPEPQQLLSIIKAIAKGEPATKFQVK
ncbi:hypothetical protein P879_11825 [Paragonimus westermani]|uniref:Uncharacterized protein n=1 Tax=Paragonimus westermani TaxID=34504 RepID=A0A8T0DE41_9TREM|nr:hypothetical protein P879_11825 [Paragonimus westermani]